MAQYQSRALHALDHVCHSERLAGAGDAKEHLRRVATHHALAERVDSGRLVARRLII